MEITNIHKAKTHLSRLVDEAAAGKEIILAKAGKPMAKLVPFREAKKTRRPGGCKGKIWVAADFDEPLPPKILKGFLKPVSKP